MNADNISNISQDSLHEPLEELWNPELLQLAIVKSAGSQRIGTCESWIELSWDISSRVALLQLYATENEDEAPTQQWERTIQIPEMPYEAEVDLVRHLTILSHLCYSLYAASPDVTSLVSEFTTTLFDFNKSILLTKTN